MKISYFPLIILLSTFYPSANAEGIEGRLDCKITGSRVEASEEGKYKSYSRMEGGPKVGDDVFLEYRVTKNSIYLSLNQNKKNEEIIINIYINVRNEEARYSVERTNNSGIIINDIRNYTQFSLLPDYIRLKHFGELSLIRYYKNDWHGMFVDFDPSQAFVQILAFNCRHTNDQLDKAFELFK